MALYPEAEPERSIWGQDVERLGTLDFDPRLAGNAPPIVAADPDSPPARAFLRVADAVMRKLSSS